MLMVNKNGNRLTPRELRRNFGNLTDTNITSQDLIRGAEKQWRRFNDSVFKEREFNEKFDKTFGVQK